MGSDLQNLNYYFSPSPKENVVFYREKIQVFKT